jgi:hypothetical protein
VSQKHLVHQALLVLEIVVKLTLPGARSFDDFVGAGEMNPLFMKQVGRDLDDAQSS